jgi:hypothetical protein
MLHPDLNKLLNEMAPFGQQMLEEQGEFFPYGAVMTTAGHIEPEAAYEGEEPPSSNWLIERLTQVFRRRAAAGEIRAAGMFYSCRITPPGQTEQTNAICASLEHQSGQFVEVFLPYNKGQSGEVNYGQVFAFKKDAKFFVQS